MSEQIAACPEYAPFFSMAGAAFALVFSSFGSAYGTSVSGTGLLGLGLFREESMMKCIVPVVMSGIVSVYGLVVSVLILAPLDASKPIALSKSFMDLGAGLAAGLTGVAAGYALGVVGSIFTKAYADQPKLYTGSIIIFIFAEVLGLYGFIAAILLTTRENSVC